MKERYFEYDPSRLRNDLLLSPRGNIPPILYLHSGLCLPQSKGDPLYGEERYYANPQILESKQINPLLRDREEYKSVTLLVVVPNLK